MTKPIYEELLAICSACDDASSRALPSGGRFIRHLADQGPLAYLHYFYAPLTRTERERCEAAFGRDLPSELGDFIERANGATLFDKTCRLFGFAETVTRSLAVSDQAAISIAWENRVFAATNPDRWRNGWTRVGALTGWSTSLSLQAHDDGRSAVVWDDQRSVEFTSLASMLTAVVDRVAPCFACSGLRDQTGGELEAALEGLIDLN